MAGGDAITTKFKVDISDLKRGITEANKNIKLANAQFKEASSGMQNWSKSADGIRAKLSQLQTVLSNQVSKLGNYRSELSRVEDAAQENGRRADELRAKLQQLASQGVSETSEEYKKYQKALTDVEKEQAANERAAEALKVTILNQQAAVNRTSGDIDKWSNNLSAVEEEQRRAESATGKLTSEITDQQKELDKLKQKYKDVVLEQGRDSDAAQELADEIRNLSGDLRDNQRRLEDVDDAADELDDSLEEAGEAAEEASGGFTVMKGALANLVADGIRKAIDAAKEFATGMIDAAATVKAQNSQFSQTFGDLEADATKAIRAIADETGILETRLQSTGAGIFAFARSSGATTEEAMQLMQDSLIATADSAAYYDKSLEESAETLQSFLKGNFANDAALGVSATEFTRNAKATELFGKKYNDLTEIQKQQTLLKMVTDSQKLSGAMGQAAREADGWENVQGNLNEAWFQFQAAVGTPFLNALIPVIQNVTKSFQEWQQSVDWDAFGAKVENAANKIINAFEWIMKNKDAIIAGIAGIAAAFAVIKIGSLVVMILKFINTIRTAGTIMSGLSVAFAAIGGPITIIIALIAGLVTAFVVLWKKSDSFRNFWIGLWDSIKNVFSGVGEAIGKFFTETVPNLFNSFVNFFTTLPERISAKLTDILLKVVDFAAKLKESFSNGVKKAIDAVVKFFTELPNKIGFALGYVIGKIAKFGVDIYKWATTEVPKFIKKVVQFFKELPSKIWNALVTAYNKVKQWGTNVLTYVKAAIPQIIQKVVQFFKELPAKIWNALVTAYNKVKNWASDVLKFIKIAIPKVIVSVVNFFKELPSKIQTHLTSAINKVKKWASDLSSKGKEAGSKLLTSIVNKVKEIPSKLKSLGSDIVSGLWNGITGKVDWLVGKIKGFANSVISGFKKGFDSHSPSRRMRDEVGVHIATGLAAGIDKGTKSVTKSITKLAKKAISDAKSSFTKSGFDTVSKNVLSSASKTIDDFVTKSTTSIKTLVNGSIESYSKSIDKKIDKINKSVTKQTNAINADKKLSAAQKKSMISKIKDSGKAEIAELKKNKDNYSKAGKASITAYTNALKDYATNAKAAVSAAMQKVNDAFTEKYNTLVESQKDLQKKLADFGNLYKINDNGTLELGDLKAQTKAITKYANDLNSIKGKVSKDLFSAISDMSMEEGQKYVDTLLSMSDKELKAYNSLYTKKLKAAKNLSQSVYSKDLETLNKDYNKAVDKALGGLGDKLTKVGANAMKGFINGMKSQKSDMAKDIKKIANTIVDQFKKELKIKSPSRRFANEVGKFIPSGIGVGIENNAKQLVKSVKRVTNQAVALSQEMLSGLNAPKLALAGGGTAGASTTVVNNNYTQTINAPKQPSRLELYRQTKNLLSLKGGV